MPRGIEAKLQDKFIALLKKENILHIKTTGGLSYLPASKVERTQNGLYTGEFRPIKSKEGFADVIVFYDNETLFIEIKNDTGKLRPSQTENFLKLIKTGHKCYILRPKHWELIKKLKYKISFSKLLVIMDQWNV